jgi:ABC-type dipeptide/oligopeptide/nickel transport system permease subunit
MEDTAQGGSVNQNGAIARLDEASIHRPQRRFLRAFLRNRIAIAGLFIVVTMVFAALFGPSISPYNPNQTNARDRLQPPGSQYFLGTDEFGRDIFSRLLYGARVSLEVAFIAQSISTIIGVIMGLVSGWYGGLVDDFIMRLTDALFALPTLVFLIVWVSILEPSKQSIFLSLGLIGWASTARMMRSQVLVLKALDYVTAARALGARPVGIMLRHILPNGIAPIIVLASLGTAGVILAESGLSFLGLGVEIPNPSWGSMIDTGRNYFTNAWWYAIFPGLAIMITVLGFNFIGDGLRDALDPRQYE